MTNNLESEESHYQKIIKPGKQPAEDTLPDK